MSRIRLTNFGPIKKGLENSEWIEIKKTTIFIGNQGSGKSTIAKLISTFSWMEKALIRGDYNTKYFTAYNRFRKTYCAYHRIENYFFDSENNDSTFIEYQGEKFHFKYQNGNLSIDEIADKKGELTQVIYVPAERNFVSNVNNTKHLKGFPNSLIEFISDYDKAKSQITAPVELPINNVQVEYDRLNDIMHIKGSNYKVRLSESSSGFQSLTPMFIVAQYFTNLINEQKEFHNNDNLSSDEIDRFKTLAADILNNDILSIEQKRAAISVAAAKFKKTAFINIVEEPEQNLFPDSQKKILFSLLKLNNTSKGNKLILTTHSPYIISFLNIAIKANELKEKTEDKALLDKISGVVPLQSTVSIKDIAIYELNGSGSLYKLKAPFGIPSDDNILNNIIEKGNDMFDNLLDIEKTIRIK